MRINPDFGEPGHYRADPRARRIFRTFRMTGKLTARSMGNFGEDEFEDSQRGKDWAGIPYNQRCPIHFFGRHLLYYTRYVDVCNCGEEGNE